MWVACTDDWQVFRVYAREQRSMPLTVRPRFRCNGLALCTSLRRGVGDCVSLMFGLMFGFGTVRLRDGDGFGGMHFLQPRIAGS